MNYLFLLFFELTVLTPIYFSAQIAIPLEILADFPRLGQLVICCTSIEPILLQYQLSHCFEIAIVFFCLHHWTVIFWLAETFYFEYLKIVVGLYQQAVSKNICIRFYLLVLFYFFEYFFKKMSQFPVQKKPGNIFFFPHLFVFWLSF